MNLAIGQILSGKVTGVTSYGAFIALPEGRSGLVHISEVSKGFVKDIGEVLKVGDEVGVKVISVESDNKIGLSIKQAQQSVPNSPPAEFKSFGASPSENFEDMLLKFKQDSKESFSVLKKSFESKRGSSIKKNINKY